MAIRRYLFILPLALLALFSAASTADGRQVASSTFSTFAAAHQIAGSNAYTAADIATAYDVSPLSNQGITGAGQTIALIEFDAFSPADIQQFDTDNQLPDPAIQETYAGGRHFTLSKSPETTLDLEWAHALAPGATIQVYYLPDQQAGQAGWRTLAQTVSTAAQNAGIISMSFGACSPSKGYTALQKVLAHVEQGGASVFVSSGDSGSLPGPARDCGKQRGVPYPASDPSVVAVGGTTLSLAQDSSIASEIAWRYSGGGKGAPLLRAPWQITPQLHPGKYRWAPDVAFLADQHTGVEVFYQGRWIRAGGTSLGAPAWAGIWALIRQQAAQAGQPLSAAPPLIYRIGGSTTYAQAFHDVTTGTNGYYHAAPGWDPVTGWGTPDVTALAAAVQAVARGGA